MPALDGMRVLDMTQYEAGTACTQALAWLGADVVKIERPGTGDPGRGVWAKGEGDSEYFLNWNANKRSVAIDLEKPEGRELLLRMLPRYDVFVENFGPGVVEKLDLDYDVMRAVHPGIIYGRIKGFGMSGPYARYKCFDMVAQAAAGAFSVTGTPDGPPQRPGPTTGDAGSGLQLALAITAAYIQRQRNGEGQLIELSMQEAMTFFMRTMVAATSSFGEEATPRRGNSLGGAITLFPCKPFGSNDYIYIMGVTPRMWQALCQTIGRPDLLTDPRFERAAGRRENSDALVGEIAKWTRERTKYEAMRELAEAGVPCSAVFDTRDLFYDPHLKERGFIHEVDHDALGTIRLLGWPARMSKSDVPLKAGPLLGQHTDEVIAADLDLSEEEMQRLRQQDIIA